MNNDKHLNKASPNTDETNVKDSAQSGDNKDLGSTLYTIDDDLDEVLNIIHKKHEKANAADSANTVTGAAANTNKSATPPSVKPDISGTRQFNAAKANNPHPPAERTRVDTDAVRAVSGKPNTSSSPKSSAHPNSKPTGTSNKSNSAVSLDDFADKNHSTDPKKNTSAKKQSTGLLSGFMKIIIYLVCVFGISIIISISAINIGNDIFAFVKEDKEITITIPKDATTSQVAKILKKNGVISHPLVYRIYTSFRISKRSYLTGEYETGEHTVNSMMSYDKLLEELSVMDTTDNSIVRITIPEGYSVSEILELFEKNGMRSAEEFNQALQEYDYDYRFMDGLTKESGLSDYRFDTNYGYRLEGYLFPDTYDFYVDENPISVISKLLDNFERKFDESFYERCDELGYTVDEIITIASMIEREGNRVDDYAKISSVFHNRLKNSANYPYLDSDATVQYALGSHKSKLEKGDTSIESPYNTYKNRGLPPGAIANPGYEAIYAALYPETTPYYYFLSRNDGVTVYSRTYDEHLRAIAESNRIDAQMKQNNG